MSEKEIDVLVAHAEEGWEGIKMNDVFRVRKLTVRREMGSLDGLHLTLVKEEVGGKPASAAKPAPQIILPHALDNQPSPSRNRLPVNPVGGAGVSPPQRGRRKA
jgi:hypothetical protein